MAEGADDRAFDLDPRPAGDAPGDAPGGGGSDVPPDITGSASAPDAGWPGTGAPGTAGPDTAGGPGSTGSAGSDWGANGPGGSPGGAQSGAWPGSGWGQPGPGWQPRGAGWQPGSEGWQGAGFNAGGGGFGPPFGQASGYGPGGAGPYGPGYGAGPGGYGPAGPGGYGPYGPVPWTRQPGPPWVIGEGIDKLVAFLAGLFLNIPGLVGTIAVMYLWAGNNFGPQDEADRREHAKSVSIWSGIGCLAPVALFAIIVILGIAVFAASPGRVEPIPIPIPTF